MKNPNKKQDNNLLGLGIDYLKDMWRHRKAIKVKIPYTPIDFEVDQVKIGKKIIEGVHTVDTLS